MITVKMRDGDRLKVNGQLFLSILRVNSDTVEIDLDGTAIQELEIDHPGSGKPDQQSKSEAATPPKPQAAQPKPPAAIQPGPQPHAAEPQSQPRGNGHNGNGHNRSQYVGHGRPQYNDTTNQYGRGRSAGRGNP
jgi:hypothetical protein